MLTLYRQGVAEHIMVPLARDLLSLLDVHLKQDTLTVDAVEALEAPVTVVEREHNPTHAHPPDSMIITLST